MKFNVNSQDIILNHTEIAYLLNQVDHVVAQFIHAGRYLDDPSYNNEKLVGYLVEHLEKLSTEWSTAKSR